MFSQEERCIYTNNQLMEVICQLRFPTILAVGAREPVDFQDAAFSPATSSARTSCRPR